MLMSKTAVDYCDDTNHQRLHKLMKLANVPEFVTSAPVPANDEVLNGIKQLPAAVFADTASRKFPLHTKAATWLAQAYFSHDRHLYTTQQAATVQDKIDKAAQYWGIEGFTKQARTDVETLMSRVPPELTESDYALIVEQDGRKTPMLPIYNAENVKAAAATLYNMRSKCPYEWRMIAARKILHKAAQLEVKDIGDELSVYLTKAAALGSSFPSMAAEHIAHRMLMIPDSQKDVKVAAAKLAKAVNNMPGLPSSDQLVKLATIVDRIDREQGFTKYYDEAGLDMPEEIFFALTREKAASIRDSFLMLTTGTVIPFEALQAAPLAKIASTLGFLERVQDDNSLDISVRKFAKLASTLPRDDAQLLERLLRAAQVPVKDPLAADLM